MKLQLDGQSLRIGVDEHELSSLLSGHMLESALGHGGVTVFRCLLGIDDAPSLKTQAGRLEFQLARTAVSRALARWSRGQALCHRFADTDGDGIDVEVWLDTRNGVLRRASG